MTLIERYRPVTTQRFALSSNSWPCGHLTPRPAVTQRLVLSSNSWPCGHLTPRPAVTQRLVLSSNSWPCGHLTPRPAVTQRFVLSSNSWPCGHLTPCPAATQRFSLWSNSADIFGPDPPLPTPRICFPQERILGRADSCPALPRESKRNSLRQTLRLTQGQRQDASPTRLFSYPWRNPLLMSLVRPDRRPQPFQARA
jgi:hypothetical protein